MAKLRQKADRHRHSVFLLALPVQNETFTATQRLKTVYFAVGLNSDLKTSPEVNSLKMYPASHQTNTGAFGVTQMEMSCVVWIRPGDRQFSK